MADIIYIMRHFKVETVSKNSKLNSTQFDGWVQAYDKCELRLHDVDLPKVGLV